MKNKRKISLLVYLAILICFIFTGCISNSNINIENIEEITTSIVNNQEIEITTTPTTITETTNETTNETTTEKNTTHYNPTTIVHTTSLTTDFVQPTANANEQPEINNLLSLCNYLNKQKDANIFKFSFIYTGNEVFNGGMLARMTNSYYISYTYVGNKYDIVITEYPGDRIVDAWRSGNTSKLNADEISAMNTAISMVNKAKAKATNDYELELIIHDMLADHITYYDGNRKVENSNDIKRQLTVLGALLDGKANCQGYTDAFYTLGSIAGFRIGRMSVETSDDLHMTNTICLNNKWYIVDVTYNDLDFNGIINYYLFNAGKDMVEEYSWPAYNEANPIEPISDSLFYYNHYGQLYIPRQSKSQK